ncbi:MAG TPA: copper-containing nitrite reductase [Terriglobales bacterium]|nr:copper-containing nitrite reductase [Terriglobales bacterium]
MKRSYRAVSSWIPGVLVVSLVLLVGSGPVPAQSHTKSNSEPKVVNIVRNAADVPAPVGSRAPAVVHVTLNTIEVTGQLDPSTGTTYRYWTFGGKVPGPMIRVRQGDTVEVTLNNDRSSTMVHSVDFHAALGAGGGGVLSQTTPGQSKTFTFKATTPGLYVYHCATPMVAEHISNGMYGMILVEPEGGLPHVDHEYYLMQGELYTAASKGKTGLQQFSQARLMQEQPEYLFFNGAVDSLTKEHSLRANVGETVRVFFGNAGPNNTSSLHVMGQIFTRTYQLGSMTSPPLTSVQTVTVPAGGATVLEMDAATSGDFHIVDHALTRMAKGLMATLKVEGQANVALMHPGPASNSEDASQEAVPTATAVAANAGGSSVTHEGPATQAAQLTGMTAADAADAAAIPANLELAENKPSGTEMDMSGTDHGQPAANPTRPSMRPISAKAPVSPTRLNGCLKLLEDGRVMLHLLGSNAIYRLEAQPIAFSENSDRLVHVTGKIGSVVQNEDPNIPSFVVDNVRALAPNCSAKISASALRELDDEGQEPAASGPAVTTAMNETAFTSPKIVIQAGQKIVWKNSSQAIHNVIADASKTPSARDVRLPAGAKPFSSTYIQPGQSFSHVFTRPGVYHYVCTLHAQSGMKGTIVVK